MGKYKEAYLEACSIMINESKHCSLIKEVIGFNLNLLKCNFKDHEEIDNNEEEKNEISEEDKITS